MYIPLDKIHWSLLMVEFISLILITLRQSNMAMEKGPLISDFPIVKYKISIYRDFPLLCLSTRGSITR